MKKGLLLAFIILGSIGFAYAQAQPQTDREKEARNAREAAHNDRVDALRNNGKQIFIRDRYKEDRIYIDVIRPLYRSKLTDEEEILLQPSTEDSSKYSDFLKDKDSGIIKLLNDKGCDGGTETVVAKPECEKLTMPGAGSSYSFRAERYSIKRLSDLTFLGENFDADGSVKHGILVNLGDMPLDKVTTKTKNLETLVDFKPITDYEDAAKMSGILNRGVDFDKFVVASSLKVKENNTYGLRSIAYKASVYQRVQDTTYDEFDFDERDDVLIVFRVVRLIPGESVTIVWKELKNKRAPKMILPKDKR